VALTWDPPAQGLVQGYTVTATALNTSSPALPIHTVTSTADTYLGLTPGSSYVFTVEAFNTAGPGVGVPTSAVNLVSIGTSGTGTSTGVPTPAIVAQLPNSIPVAPLPAVYYPLVLSSDPDDGDSLATAAIQRLADLIGNGWRPYLSNPEVAAVQVAAFIAADLRTLVRDAGAAMFSAFGQMILQNPQRPDSASVITTTWTALDNVGHTIPAGTQVSYPAAGSTPLTFTLRGDVVIQPGSTSVEGIVLLSDQTGAYTNQVPTGPLEVQGSIIWLDSVVVTTAAANGADAESDADYRTRLIGFTKTLGQTLVLPMDYALTAQQSSSAVYRAYAVPNYDANNPTQASVERTVSVFMLQRSGLPVPPDVAATVGAQLSSRREAGFNVVVLDGSGHTIAPEYVSVAVSATVVARPGFALVDVQHSCVQALTSFLDPGNWEGGGVTPPSWSGRVIIRPHDLAALLVGVPGVDHIDALTIGGGASAISGTDNYELAPATFTKAVLPAGTFSSSYWTTPSTITVTANAPA
jgi:hypothetical protein